MQSVTNLNQYDTDIVTHGQQQLLEVFCLSRCLLTEDASGNLGQSIDDLCYLCTKDVLYVLGCVVCILYHIVQQGRTDACRTQSHFLARYLCYGYGVHDVWLARQAAYSFVCLLGEVECFGNQIDFLSMARS